MPGNLARVIDEYQEAGELLQRVNAVISESALTQVIVARETGLSPAALNQWLQGKYKGDNSEVENKLEKWLAARGRRVEVGETLPVRGTYIATPAGERIKGVLSYTQAAADLSVIYGGAGVGKTRAIKSYAGSAPNVWVATMRPDTAGVASCLEEISEAVGMKMPGRAARQSRDLSKRMAGTGGLLIIDEAQHLSLTAIEAVRSIYDVAEIGLVLCGNESVYARLTGGSRAATFAQLFVAILAARYGGRTVRFPVPHVVTGIMLQIEVYRQFRAGKNIGKLSVVFNQSETEIQTIINGYPAKQTHPVTANSLSLLKKQIVGVAEACRGNDPQVDELLDTATCVIEKAQLLIQKGDDLLIQNEC